MRHSRNQSGVSHTKAQSYSMALFVASYEICPSLVLVDQFQSLICESLAQNHGPFPGKMDATVGLLCIAAIKVIRIEPGVASGLSQLDLGISDAAPVLVVWSVSGIVVDAADHKVQIISTQILFEMFDQFCKTFCINLGEAVVGVRLALHPDEANCIERLIFFGS